MRWASVLEYNPDPKSATTIIRQALPFVRDGVIVFAALVVVQVLSLAAMWWVRMPFGPASASDFLIRLGMIVLGSAFIGCLVATAIRYMGQPALWKDLAACAVASFAWSMVTSLPVSMNDRLLSSLFLAVFSAGGLKKGRRWLAERYSSDGVGGIVPKKAPED